MRVPKYRKHSQKNFGFVEFRGVRYRLPGTFESETSLTAYHEFIQKYVLQDKHPPLPRPAVPGALTCIELVVHFLDWAQEHYPDSAPRRGAYWDLRTALTAKRKKPSPKAKGRLAFSELFGDVRAADFGPLRLKRMQQLLTEQGQGREWINKQVEAVKRMFKWAASEELVPVGVWQALTAVPGLKKGRSEAPDRPPRRPVSWEDVEATLPWLHEPVRTMVLFQWHTGARSSSICLASPDQFDRSDEGLWLWTPRHKTEYRGKSVVVPIGPRCRQILKPYLHGRQAGYLFDPREWRNGSNARYRDHYDRSSYRQAVIRAQAKAREEGEHIAPWTPHQIRHAKATELRKLFGIDAARILLGHSSLDVTAVYAERDLETAKRIARQVG